MRNASSVDAKGLYWRASASEDLPPGWLVRTHQTIKGRIYKTYQGPDGRIVKSLKVLVARTLTSDAAAKRSQKLEAK